jgi:hypothetical protein
MDYVLILLIGFIGGLPLGVMFVKAGYPAVGLVIWLGVFLFAVWAVCDAASNKVRRADKRGLK